MSPRVSPLPQVQRSSGPQSPQVHRSTKSTAPQSPQVHRSTGPQSPQVHRVHRSTVSTSNKVHRVHRSTGLQSPRVHRSTEFTESTGPQVYRVHGSTGPQSPQVHRSTGPQSPQVTKSTESTGPQVHRSTGLQSPRVHRSTEFTESTGPQSPQSPQSPQVHKVHRGHRSTESTEFTGPQVQSPIITSMVSCSLTLGYFPVAWKAALVDPRLKKRCQSASLSNLGPLRNLQLISKLTKRVVYYQTQVHLVRSELYPTLQSAYRAGHSTETALLKAHKMKFLAIESLRISLKLNISAAREQQAVGLGLFNVVAAWVMACEYLSLGLHVGNHSRPTPLTIIFYSFCSPTIERSEVLNIVDTTIARNNDSLVDSMKRILNESLSDIKRANSESADSHLREMKKLKFEEPRRFKKKANEDQYRFNSKLSDVLTEAKSSCSSQQLDKVKESLDKGESLLAERQKHILLADKSDFGWMIIQEYKKNDLADDSDDQKKIIRAEARARSQAKQNALKSKSRFAPVRRDFPKSLPIPSNSVTDSSSAVRPIPTLDGQFRSQIKPGSCFACNKPGHWRAQCPLLTSKPRTGQ